MPGGGLAPLSVTFDATGSRDPDPGDTISYGWDFTSDGVVDSTEAQPSLTYRSAGRYPPRRWSPSRARRPR